MNRVLGLDRNKTDRLYMFLELDEQFEAINLPMRVRKAQIQMRYKKHTPEIWVRTHTSEPERVMSMNTRRKFIETYRPKFDENRLFVEHLVERLMALNCYLAMSYDVEPKTQRKRVRLLVRSSYSVTVSHTLHWIYRGEESPWLGEFLPDKSKLP